MLQLYCSSSPTEQLRAGEDWFCSVQCATSAGQLPGE